MHRRSRSTTPARLLLVGALLGGTIAVTASPAAAAPNEAPVANDDYYTTLPDTELTVPAPGIFENDTDADGDPLQLVVATDTVEGTLVLEGDGSFTYMPDPGFHGIDTFEYTITDGSGAFATATVMIFTNNAPVANDDEYTTPAGTELTVPAPGVFGNDFDADGDLLQLVGYTDAAHGTVELKSDGSFTYMPDPGFRGVDTFEYTITDGLDTFVTATVTITVNPSGVPPVAAPAGPEGPVTVGDVVVVNGGGSTSADGGQLTYAWAQTGGPAAVLGDADTMRARFVPDAPGTYVFALTVCDVDDLCDTETVEVVVLAAAVTPPPPAAAPPTAPALVTGEAAAARPTSRPGALPQTGTTPIAPIGAGILLLGLGVGMAAASRRRLER